MHLWLFLVAASANIEVGTIGAETSVYSTPVPVLQVPNYQHGSHISRSPQLKAYARLQGMNIVDARPMEDVKNQSKNRGQTNTFRSRVPRFGENKHGLLVSSPTEHQKFTTIGIADKAELPLNSPAWHLSMKTPQHTRFGLFGSKPENKICIESDYQKKKAKKSYYNAEIADSGSLNATLVNWEEIERNLLENTPQNIIPLDFVIKSGITKPSWLKHGMAAHNGSVNNLKKEVASFVEYSPDYKYHARAHLLKPLYKDSSDVLEKRDSRWSAVPILNENIPQNNYRHLFRKVENLPLVNNNNESKSAQPLLNSDTSKPKSKFHYFDIPILESQTETARKVVATKTSVEASFSKTEEQLHDFEIEQDGALENEVYSSGKASASLKGTNQLFSSGYILTKPARSSTTLRGNNVELSAVQPSNIEAPDTTIRYRFDAYRPTLRFESVSLQTENKTKSKHKIHPSQDHDAEATHIAELIGIDEPDSTPFPDAVNWILW